MNAPVFVDTNVLVYRLDATEPDKQRRADAWLRHLWRERLGRISFQVVQELYVTLTRKLPHPLEPEDARRQVTLLFAWNPVPVDAEVVGRAWELESRYQLSWWDSLVVAAAEATGSRWLLTEDLQDGQQLGEVRVVSPFRALPDTLAP